jgi:hypothetical protein
LWQAELSYGLKNHSGFNEAPELLGQELSGVPVDARISHGEAQAISMQPQMKQEYLIAKSGASTTAPKGV